MRVEPVPDTLTCWADRATQVWQVHPNLESHFTGFVLSDSTAMAYECVVVVLKVGNVLGRLNMHQRPILQVNPAAELPEPHLGQVNVCDGMLISSTSSEDLTDNRKPSQSTDRPERRPLNGKELFQCATA